MGCLPDPTILIYSKFWLTVSIVFHQLGYTYYTHFIRLQQPSFLRTVYTPYYMEYVHYYVLFLTCFSGLVFLFGACMGSFMDVARVRLSWKKVVRGRSKCRSCKKELCWYELLPVVSYVVLWGRCYACKKSIPLYHLAAEVLMGLLFVFAFLYALMGGFPYNTLVVLLSAIFLVPIVLQDIETMEVPEHISLLFAYVAFVVGIVTGGISAVLGGLILALPFFLLWLCSSGKAMGLGDAKVAVSLGFLLPSLMSVVSVFMFTFWIGLLVLLGIVLCQLLRKGKMTVRRGTQMPLVPCMAAAHFLVLLTDVSFIDVLYSVQYTLFV